MEKQETTRSNGAEYHALKMQIENWILGANDFRKAMLEVCHIAHVTEAELILRIEKDKSEKRRHEAEIKFIKLD